MSRELEDWGYEDPAFDALGLSATEASVARYLFWRISSKTGWWYESVDAIAAKVYLSEKTVRRALDRLEVVAGMVRARRRDRRGYGMEYVYSFPELQPVDSTSWEQAQRPGLPVRESDGPTGHSVRTGPVTVTTPDRSQSPHKKTREENEGKSEGTRTPIASSFAPSRTHEPSSRFCGKHPGGTAEACRDCGEARQRYEASQRHEAEDRQTRPMHSVQPDSRCAPGAHKKAADGTCLLCAVRPWELEAESADVGVRVDDLLGVAFAGVAA